MALRDEIEAARDRTLSLLNDSHDYFTYSKQVWRILQTTVQRYGLKVSMRNLSTNSTVNEQDLLRRAQRYAAQELPSTTLQQFVSIFEDYQSNVLRCWLRAYPKSLSKRQLSGEDVFNLPDKNAMIDALVDKELMGLTYARPTKWFKYLRELVKIRVPTVADEEQFAEIKATRDVLVHGYGVANAYYVDKAGKSARVQPGQALDIPEPYHQASWELIRKLVIEIGTAMAAKA